MKIISLVPSITEALFDLGLTEVEINIIYVIHASAATMYIDVHYYYLAAKHFERTLFLTNSECLSKQFLLLHVVHNV